MPRLTITSPRRCRSFPINASNAAGESPAGIAPVANTRSLTSAMLMTFTFSACKCFVPSGGVPTGTTLHEESAGVPLIVAGPDVPAGHVVDSPVSHIDCAPTILASAGLPPRVGGSALPGASLFDLANGATSKRPVISEYHATASTGAAYMLRFGMWKYCHYVGAPPKLFDLAADPQELTDLASDQQFAAVLAEGECRLRTVLDPEATDARAKRRQAELLAQYGGREKALARGDLGFTPAPGTAAEIS